ncbi:MAG: putative toxin-antitoxin system toxin component, PIN family [Bacteroidales bacterium]|jgi:putative PIN family toxin of toxin-antitoxin system|nr:putative toxin-antitoxin system toxin component, PIN family [Bacteroidales bacterium]
MKTVVDINILISASIWRGKPEAVILRAAEGLDTLFVTDDIIAEIENTIQKPKFENRQEQINAIMSIVEKYGKKITVHPEHKITDVCRDPKDNIYLECAIAAQADYIITGDKDLLVLKEYQGVKIVNANEYLEMINR